jgi:hypothetical protein
MIEHDLKVDEETFLVAIDIRLKEVLVTMGLYRRLRDESVPDQTRNASSLIWFSKFCISDSRICLIFIRNDANRLPHCFFGSGFTAPLRL